MDNLVSHIKQELLNLGEDSEKFVGCTPAQIEEIMQKQGVSKFPGLYRDFMLEMGRGAGTLFQGSAFYYGAMMYFNFKEEALDLLKEVVTNFQIAEFQIPEKAFVFLYHQGYEFLYFDTIADEYDSVVYIYVEGELESRELGRLSTLFLREIELLKSLKR